MTGRIAIALLALAARIASAEPVCGSNTPLTLIGIDTTSGTMLISAPPLGPAGPWVIELSGDGSRARLHEDRARGRFGGSVGPGPVIAASPCGKSCVQPVRWAGGSGGGGCEQLMIETAVRPQRAGESLILQVIRVSARALRSRNRFPLVHRHLQFSARSSSGKRIRCPSPALDVM